MYAEDRGMCACIGKGKVNVCAVVGVETGS